VKKGEEWNKKRWTAVRRFGACWATACAWAGKKKGRNGTERVGLLCADLGHVGPRRVPGRMPATGVLRLELCIKTPACAQRGLHAILELKATHEGQEEERFLAIACPCQSDTWVGVVPAQLSNMDGQSTFVAAPFSTSSWNVEHSRLVVPLLRG